MGWAGRDPKAHPVLGTLSTTPEQQLLDLHSLGSQLHLPPCPLHLPCSAIYGQRKERLLMIICYFCFEAPALMITGIHKTIFS